MSEKSNKKFIGITPELKDRFKALLKEFNVMPVAPVTTPVIPATPAPEAKKFGEATLKDGTVVKWEGEQLIAGVPLMVIDPNNPEGFLPMPDTKEEGVEVVIDGVEMILKVKEGKVDSITPATPEAPAMPDMSAQFKAVEDKFNAVIKDKVDLETKFTAEIESLKKANEDLTKFVKGFTQMFSEAMDTPTADPIETPKPMSKGEKLHNLIHGK